MKHIRGLLCNLASDKMSLHVGVAGWGFVHLGVVDDKEDLKRIPISNVLGYSLQHPLRKPSCVILLSVSAWRPNSEQITSEANLNAGEYSRSLAV